MVLVGVFAPLIATHDPTAYSLFDAKQGPVAAPLLRHDRPGHGHLLAGRLGHADLALPRRRRGALATVLAATLGVLGAYCGGWVDDLVNFATNVFLVIPTIPLLVVVSAYLKSRGSTSMILILGLTLWAFEARILRAQALSLRNRDFILAAKVAGESTWRIIFLELMPNMISRIAAAFVLVFYVSILTEAGLEFLGLGNMARLELGRHALLGAGQLERAAGRVVDVPVPRPRARADRRGARVHPRRARRGQQPAAAQAGSGQRRMLAGMLLGQRARHERRRDARSCSALEDLSVDYVLGDRRVRAVDGVSLSIAPGEILGLAGESGCGKSTLANAVLQILRPPAEVSGGRILFRGDDLAGDDARSSCGGSAGATSRSSSRAR